MTPPNRPPEMNATAMRELARSYAALYRNAVWPDKESQSNGAATLNAWADALEAEE